MKAYKDMTREELFAEKEKLEAMYQDYKGQNLALNMSRGKPSASQLDLSKGMMDVLRSDSNLTCEDGTDCRNYGVLLHILFKKHIRTKLKKLPHNTDCH